METMYASRNELMNANTVIHGTLRGEITCADLLNSINDWSKILQKHRSIRFLIFDFTNATLNPISSNEVHVIASKTGILTKIKKDLVMIGVTARDLEYGLCRMWKALTGMGTAQLSQNQIHVVRGLDKAFEKISEICNG